MQTNFYARLWYSCITRGSKSYSECPEKVYDYSVKPIVKEMLTIYGHEDLITEGGE